MFLGINKAPSVLTDPFNKTSVTGVYMSMFQLFGDTQIRGRVEFQNGNTCGEQKFTGSSLADLQAQIHAFLETLP